MGTSRGKRGKFVAVTLVAVTISIVAAAAAAFGYKAGAFNEFLCEGECPAEFALLPEGVKEPNLTRATQSEPTVRPIDKQALEAALAEPLSDPNLGPSVGFVAADAQTGEILMAQGSGGYIPASTTKLLTAWSVLTALGPDHRFVTSVRRSGDTLILQGGGDPYLLKKSVDRPWAGGSIEELAKETAKQVHSETVTVEFDTSMFAGDRLNNAWPARFVPRTVQPIEPLIVRAKEPTSRTPAKDAAKQFAAALEREGVTVASVASEPTSARGEVIAKTTSAPLRETVSYMIAMSDNTGSEILLRHTALADGKPATFAGGTQAVRDLLKEAKFDTSGLRLSDGSGLSRDNRISPRLLVDILKSARDRDSYAALITGMPVSGLTGSLTERFDFSRDARGVIRAKTGTLNDVSALAGWATLDDGRTIIFAVMADQISGYPLGPPQDAIDRVAAAVAGCAC